ncbi:hypothetical protein FB451DRAFT_1433259 [Mycena latifolia]|nr:hypothetical protein FB451DRAFT_1433259 [Mycena latifolia]
MKPQQDQTSSFLSLIFPLVLLPLHGQLRAMQGNPAPVRGRLLHVREFGARELHSMSVMRSHGAVLHSTHHCGLLTVLSQWLPTPLLLRRCLLSDSSVTAHSRFLVQLGIIECALSLLALTDIYAWCLDDRNRLPFPPLPDSSNSCPSSATASGRRWVGGCRFECGERVMLF